MRLCQFSRPCYLTAASLLHSGKNHHYNISARLFLSTRRTVTARKMTTYPLVDVDCNLWHKDLQTLQQRQSDDSGDDGWSMLHEDAISSANIVGMLSPSSTLTEARNGLQRLIQHPTPPVEIRTTVGVHPYHVNDVDENWLDSSTLDDRKAAMLSLLRDPDHRQWIAAVGECGLDASDGFPPISDQLPWFEFQIQVAEELQLPLFVHERLAFDDTMRLLEKVTVPTIIHCFTGTTDEARQYIERGYYLSVSGYILKNNDEGSQEVRKCLETNVIPLDRLMIETDAPYMGFEGCRKLYLEHNSEYFNSLNSKKKKRLQNSIYPNVPSCLPQVLEAVTDCLKKHDSSITVEQVAKATTVNARSFFGFSSFSQTNL